jgi:phospholipid-binding lipoprotein MlaA
MQRISSSCPGRTGATRILANIALAAVLLTGCAQKPPASDPDAVAEYQQTNDPLEPTNRVFYAVNNGIDTVILRPFALAWRHAVPGAVRDRLHNVLANIGLPVQLANDVLQAKPKRAGDTFARLGINSTVGVLGIFDVATGWGFPDHDADFGMTLAYWGVPEGPFLYLPVLGPSNPRDAAGFGVDIALDPFTWAGPPSDTGLKAFKWSRTGVNAVDTRERFIDPIDQIKKTALDPYATFRSLSRQHRQAQIQALRDDSPPPPMVPAAK